jgi:hypothetical protein
MNAKYEQTSKFISNQDEFLTAYDILYSNCI